MAHQAILVNYLELSSIDSKRQLKDVDEEDSLIRVNKSITQSSKIEIQSMAISTANATKNSLPVYEYSKLDANYQIMDLTYTFLTIPWNTILIIAWLIIMLLLRFYTMGCLIYVVVISPSMWEWVIVVFASRMIYLIAVIKVSLKIPQTKTQLILKHYWDSHQSQIHQIFAQIQIKKLLISLIRGLIPVQLSFIYLKPSHNGKRKLYIYSGINYMYCSIEALIYYPFFIIYCAIINQDNSYALNIINPNFTIILASLGEIILVVLSVYLIYIGCRKKYGSFLNFKSTYIQKPMSQGTSSL